MANIGWSSRGAVLTQAELNLSESENVRIPFFNLENVRTWTYQNSSNLENVRILISTENCQNPLKHFQIMTFSGFLKRIFDILWFLNIVTFSGSDIFRIREKWLTFLDLDMLMFLLL